MAGEKVVDDEFVDDINGTIDTYISHHKWLEQYMTFEDELAAAWYNAEKRWYAIGEREGRKERSLDLAAKLVHEGIMDPLSFVTEQ